MTDAAPPLDRPAFDAAVAELLHEAVAAATPSGTLRVTVRTGVEAPDAALP
jgi:hypothetical protein